MGQWKNKACAKNLPPRDDAWKKKITISYLLKKGYAQEQAEAKANLWYTPREQSLR